MKRYFHMAITVTGSAAIVAALLCLGGTAAVAQPIPWNPPCTMSKIFNNTPCNAIVTLTTIPPGLFPPTFVAAGGTTPLVFPVGSFVTGIVTQLGTPVASVSPGPPLPPPNPPVPTAGWVPNVTFGPAPGCCFDVYFVQPGAGCYIWLEPSTAPPPCTP